MTAGQTPLPSNADAQPATLRFGAFTLDEGAGRLLQGGQPVHLAPKAFAVLCALARNPGRLIEKASLLDLVWGHRHVTESVLKSVVSELREALADDARQPRVIETIPRRGYRFVGTIVREMPVIAHDGDAVTRNDGVDLVGRTDAVSKLHTAWGRTRLGQRQIVWVSGDAGIGKTTLVDRFAQGVGAARIARGQCVEQHGVAEPYLPVLEALASLCRADATVISVLRVVAPTWLMQIPWLSSDSERATLQRELSGVGAERMLREFAELVDRLAAAGPLLLITEDLHWSDHATVRLIDYVARRREATKLMWLATFRVAQVVAEEHPLKAVRNELRLHRLCQEIGLDQFSQRDIAAFMSQRFDTQSCPEALVHALHARTDGLPLFLVNIVDDLVERKLLSLTAPDAALAALETWPLPDGLVGVLERQIQRLVPAQQDMLRAASVLGVEFDVDVLAGVLERDARAVSLLCEELVHSTRWLVEDEINAGVHFGFRHALYRDVLYKQLDIGTRVDLHARAAGVLAHMKAAGRSVSAAELGGHYAACRDARAAVACYAEAVEGAMRRFAPREAWTLAQRGIELLAACPADPQREHARLALTALQGTASAQLHGVGARDTKRCFEDAHRLLESAPTHPLRGLVWHALGIVFLVRGEYAHARAHGQWVHDVAHADADVTLMLSACSVLGQTCALQGRHVDACRWLELGVKHGERLGDESLQAAFVVDPLVTIRAALAIPLLSQGRVDSARVQLEMATARARRLRQPMALLVAHWFDALFEVRLENVARVVELAHDIGVLVDTAALAQGVGPSRWFEGWATARAGDAARGYRSIRDGYEHCLGMEMLSGSSEVLSYAAEALLLAGDVDAATGALNEAMHRASQLDEQVYVPQMHVLRARIADAQGDRQATHAALDAAAETACKQGALWLELGARVHAGERGLGKEDLAKLGALLDSLTEGRDMPLVQRARRLVQTPSH